MIANVCKKTCATPLWQNVLTASERRFSLTGRSVNRPKWSSIPRKHSRKEIHTIRGNMSSRVHAVDAPAPGETLAHWLGLVELTRVRRSSSCRIPKDRTWSYLVQRYIDTFESESIAREGNLADDGRNCSAVSRKVLPFFGCHAQAEGAGMRRPTHHMAALRLAMAPGYRSREKLSNLSGIGTSLPVDIQTGVCGDAYPTLRSPQM